jgi:hypothetical protein
VNVDIYRSEFTHHFFIDTYMNFHIYLNGGYPLVNSQFDVEYHLSRSFPNREIPWWKPASGPGSCLAFLRASSGTSPAPSRGGELILGGRNTGNAQDIGI